MQALWQPLLPLRVRPRLVGTAFSLLFVMAVLSGAAAANAGNATRSDSTLAKKGAAAAPMRGITVTTGWRKISGWERDVLRKNPNLGHWAWLPMAEMNKGYRRLPAGSATIKGAPTQAGPRYAKTRYVKPQHIATVVPERAPVEPVEAVVPPGPKYVKPIHVAAPVATDTGARYIKPRHVATTVETQIKLTAPLKPPVVPPEQARATAPAVARTQVNASVRVPSTAVKLAAPQTAIALKRSSGKPISSAAADAMSGDPNAADSDQFAQPDPYEHNAYGLARLNASQSGAAKTRLEARLLGAKKKVSASR